MKRILLALLLLGCSGSTVAPDLEAVVETEYGAVVVRGPADLDAVQEYVERGFAKAAYQGYRMRAEGLSVVVVDACSGCVGYQEGDTLVMLQGKEDVLSHEVQHWAAWRLGRTGECHRCQDHCNGDRVCAVGYDLNCGVCGQGDGGGVG